VAMNSHGTAVQEDERRPNFYGRKCERHLRASRPAQVGCLAHIRKKPKKECPRRVPRTKKRIERNNQHRASARRGRFNDDVEAGEA
jgi:hypothetical protein